MMYYYSDAYFPWITHFYFIALIIICAFFILNLTIAILLDNYAENENQDGGLISNILELTDSGKEASLPKEVIDFIIHQDITTMKKKKKTFLMASNASSMNTSGKSMTSNVYHNLYVMFINHEVNIPAHHYYHYRITRWMYLVAVHPLFNSFIMLIIVMNTIFLSFERYPEPPDSQIEIFSIFNFIFTIIFTLEVIIKMIGFSIRGFVRDRFNIFDALVVISSIIEMFISGDGRGGSGLSALRAVRLFRIFKIFRVGDLRVLMDSIGLTILGMGNYVVLLFLFMYLYALLGMQFFAGKFRFGSDGLYDKGGDTPRENFDTIWEAFITVTIIMIGDGWQSIMYYGMLSEGTFFSLYFVSLYTFGNIIMLNLFLAILLGNFDSARQLMAKKKAFEEFKKLHKKGVPLKIALVIVLGDLGEYICNNVLENSDSELSEKIEKEDSKLKNEETKQERDSEKNGKEKEVRFETTRNREFEAMEQNLIFDDDKEEIKDEFYNEKIQDDERDLMGHSSDSVSEMIRNAKQSDHKLQYTGRTKLDSTIEHKNKDLTIKKSTLGTVEPPRESPANQQEGDAYDTKLKEVTIRVLDPFEENKLNENQDEEDHSKHLDESHKHLASITHRSKPENESNQNGSFIAQEFEESSSDYIEHKQKLLPKIWDYMKNSSLFIFHDSWEFRQWLIMIVVSTEFLTTRKPKSRKLLSEGEDRTVNKNSEEDSERDDNSENDNSFDDNLDSMPSSANVLKIKSMEIFNGKIVTTKRRFQLSRWFENIIIMLVIINSCALILDNPLEDPNGWLSRTFYYMDFVFTIVFTIEAIMKIIALGFFHNKIPGISPYILNGWNILDFFIV